MALDPAGRDDIPNLSPAELARMLAVDLHRRIVLGIAADGDPGSRRTQLRDGLKIAERSSRAIGGRLPDEESLVSSPEVTVLLRHALGAAERLEVTGSQRLADALAGLGGGGERADPDAQVIDLTGTGGVDVVGRVMAAIARRDAGGVTAVLVPGTPEDMVADNVREEVGKF